MGFMGGLFKALGFEGEGKSKASKQKKAKASFSLNSAKEKRVDQIDGVPVYYPETLSQTRDFLDFVKEERAIIISREGLSKEEGLRMVNYIEGFVYGINGRMIALTEDKLFLILPEGMEVEE